MRRIKHTMLFLVFVLSACNSSTPTPNFGTYPISPLFKKFYDAQGGLYAFGETVSPEVKENEITFQYFKNLRLEYHAKLPEGNRIIISNLGTKFKGYQTPCIRAQDADLTAYFFNECHSVIKAVQAFFNKMGGLYFFGYPISELAITDNGQLIQHFEHTSIIWNSKKPRDEQFGLLNVGEIAWNKTIGPVPTDPNSTEPAPARIIKIKTEPKFPVLAAAKEKQVLTGRVTDEKGAPISGATILFVVQFPGSVARYQSDPTDLAGYAEMKMNVSDFKSGDFIFYTATATYKNLTSMDNNHFVAWDK